MHWFLLGTSILTHEKIPISRLTLLLKQMINYH